MAASSEMVMLGERIGEMERRMTEKFAFPVGGVKSVEVDMGLLEKRVVEGVGKAVMGLGKRREVAEEKRLSRVFGKGRKASLDMDEFTSGAFNTD